MAYKIQRLTEKLWYFLTVFLTCSLLQRMINSFLKGGIQSIEQQFQISSSKSGSLQSANKIGHILTSLFLAYFGSKGNRARWIGAGSIIVALGCLLTASQNFIFLPKSVFKEVNSEFVINSLIYSNESEKVFRNVLSDPIISQRIDYDLRILINSSLESPENDEDLFSFLKQAVPGKPYYNESNIQILLADSISRQFPRNVSTDLVKTTELPFGYCNTSILKLKQSIETEKCKKKRNDDAANEAAYGMVFAALMLVGVGLSLTQSLGIPLIDDSVKRKTVPFYFDPPGLSPKDPRWIGAWWLSYLIVGCLLLIPSLILLFYPNVDFKSKNKRRLSEADKKKPLNEKKFASNGAENRLLASEEESKQKKRIIEEIKKFGISIALCLRSPIYVGLLLSRLLDAFIFHGLMSFEPKFIEKHYGIPSNYVSFFSGVISGSFIMRKFNLDGRRAAMYILLCSVLSIALTVPKVFLSCQSVDNAVGKLAWESRLETTCNLHCSCDKSNLYPVCSRDGTPFFSPCHAGCSNFTLNMIDSTAKIFSECQCANGTEVSREFCQSDCTIPLCIYYALSVITGIIAGTAEIPTMLITLRAVPHEVRTISLAFSSFLVSLLSTAPSPIVVGFTIDSACLLWKNNCGKKGACLLYDATALRMRYQLMFGIIRAAGLLFDIWVWYWAASLVLMKEPDDIKGSQIKKSSLSLANSMDKAANNEDKVVELLIQNDRQSSQIV